MLSIQTNVGAISAQRHMNSTSSLLTKSMERLSSGYRINRAADDAAGLAISEKLKAQRGGLNQAVRNSNDGISMIQTSEGGLDEVQNMMQRIRDLAVQASSDTNGPEERKNINLELRQLMDEIDSSASRTTFNGHGLLDGSMTSKLGTVTMASGADITGGGSTTGVVLMVGNIDVSAAATGKTFNVAVDAANANALTLTDSADATKTATVDLSTLGSLDDKGTMTLDFANVGVKITLKNSLGAAYDVGTNAATVIASLTGSVATQAGTNGAVLQTGAYGGEETAINFVDARMTSTATAGRYAMSAGMYTLMDSLNNFNTAVAGTNSSVMQIAASSLIDATDTALGYISGARATLGAAQNRLEHTIANLSTTAQNIAASNSQIRDVDVAAESADLAKNQILQQAGVSILAQANQAPQLALKLLGG